MRSGQMAQHWGTDSITKPVVMGGSVKTGLITICSMLLCKMTDTGWINTLFLDLSSMVISWNAARMGLVASCRVQRHLTKGKYMKEAAIKKYRSVVRTELDKRVKEAFR